MSASATVPEGYKQTEIGVFPKDWQIKKFGDIFDFKSTASNSRSDLTETDEAHYIHYGDIHTIFHRHLDISKKSTPRIDLSLCKNATRIRNGDWVMADASEDFSGICKAIEISGIDEDKSVVAGLHTFLLRDRNEEYSPGFKGHLGEAKFLHDQYVRVSVGLKVFGVTKTSLRDLLIPVPPKTQQKKIEEILTQADAQIQSFQHLIAKKKDIKQGTMQELLTGNTRLPGFSADWVQITLDKVGNFMKGRGVSVKESKTGNIPCIRYGEIYTVHDEVITKFYSHISAKVAASSIMIKSGDILFAGSGETRDEIGKCVAFVNDFEAYAGGDIVILRTRNISPKFLGYYLNSEPVRQQKASLGQGDAVVHIYSRQLSSIIIQIPEFNEQEAIANILADMDAEIAALEERLEKAKAIKQGMMQQLLTGKIRLVD